MIRLSKSVVAVGGIVLAGGLIAITNPKTVHAVAAALVQVTNTASNPVVTQSVGQQAGNMLVVYCDTSGCLNGGSAGDSVFTAVPADRTFVVTAIDIEPLGIGSVLNTCAYRRVDLRLNGSTMARWLNLDTHPAHFTYPTGFAIAPGTRITADLSDECGDSEIYLYGYLTAN